MNHDLARYWKLRTPIVLLAALSFGLYGGSVAVSGALRTAHVDSVKLSADVPTLGLLSDRGELPSGRQVTVGVLLSDPNRSAEEALYKQLYSRGGALYHDFLTPDQFAQRFAAPTSTVSEVRQWLSGGGLRVTFAGRTGIYWVARGPAGDVERLFQVQLHSYVVSGRTFYANDRAPQVPVGLGISMVFLTDLMQMHTDATPNTAFTATPQSLWQLYGAPSNDTGQGEQLGILGYEYKADDRSLQNALRDFEGDNHLPQVPLRVIPTDASPIASTNTDGLVEWELDTQASSGMAPGALDIDFYDGPSANLTDGAAEMAYWAADPNGPRQASASWTQCEDNPVFMAIGAGYAQAMTDAERQAVIEGRTLFASTGDTGSGCVFPFNAVPVNLNGVLISPDPMQSMPAALPYTVAVGGTVVYPQDNGDGTVSRALEYSWTHGGGGPSRFVTAPDYQQGVSNLIYPCLADDSGGTGNTGVLCRGVPDVAAMSGDITGLVPNGVVKDDYAIHDGGGAACTATPPAQSCRTTAGGTSLSSPLMLGMWARVAAATPAPLGFANETIYAIGKDPGRYARDFFDVTLGDNGLYHADSGWDYTSGWGVMNIAAFAADATGNRSLNPTHVTSAPPPLPPRPGAAKPGAGRPPIPVNDAACTALWTQPPGTDSVVGNLVSVGGVAPPPVDQGQQPQLALLSSRFSLTADEKTLRMQLVIQNLSKTVPAYSQGNIYFAFFSYAGTQWYGGVEVDPSGLETYSYGTASSGSINPLGPAAGSIGSGPGGVVEIDVPLATFGSAAGLGSSFTNTGGETFALVGVNGDQANTIGQPSLAGNDGYLTVDLSPTDSSGQFTGRTYLVGEECTPLSGRLARISIEGDSFSGTVASFSDKRATDKASEFAATISWGDGTSTAGIVSGGDGSFAVAGSHRWPAAGARQVSVDLKQVDDPNRPMAVAAGAVKGAAVGAASGAQPPESAAITGKGSVPVAGGGLAPAGPAAEGPSGGPSSSSQPPAAGTHPQGTPRVPAGAQTAARSSPPPLYLLAIALLLVLGGLGWFAMSRRTA